MNEQELTNDTLPTPQEEENSKQEESAAEPKNEEALPGAEPANIAQKLEEQIAEINDRYLRLYSEFDNYRKRTSKEKIELIKTAGEDFFKAVLPVLDDFERGMKAMHESADVKSLKEGVELIFNKLNQVLTAKGLEPMNSVGEMFNADIHDALTNIPAPSEEMKGKVIEEIEKGYLLNGKVIRFARVVVAN